MEENCSIACKITSDNEFTLEKRVNVFKNCITKKLNWSNPCPNQLDHNLHLEQQMKKKFSTTPRRTSFKNINVEMINSKLLLLCYIVKKIVLAKLICWERTGYWREKYEIFSSTISAQCGDKDTPDAQKRKKIGQF